MTPVGVDYVAIELADRENPYFDPNFMHIVLLDFNSPRFLVKMTKID